MSSSLAAIYSGVPGEIELRGISTPKPAGGEMLVRVLGCTICGSDLHSVDGRRQVPVPTVLGHEIVGEIATIGDGAPTHDLAGQPLRIGDRVTWSLVASCGECFFCQRKLPQKCLKAVKYGHEPFRPGRELLGGFAEHCLLVAGTSVVRIPDGLSLAVACPASCATATAAAAMEAAGDLKGGCVCVLGAGLLGLTVSAMAKARGAAAVICAEIHPGRRAAAERFGATHVVEPEELARDIAELSNGRGADVAFELTGSPAAFEMAWPTLRVGATFVAVGSVFPSKPVDLPLEQLVRRHLTIRGIHNYRPDHLLSAVEFLTMDGQAFPFAELVSEWYSLQDIQQALRGAHDRDTIRVGVRPE